MKKFIVLAMILAAGLYAYPQSTRTARETKTEKGNTKKEAERRTSVSRAQQKANRNETQQRNNAESQQRKETSTQQNNNAEAQQRNQQATQERNNAEAQQRNQEATQQRNNAEAQQRNQQATQQRNNAEAQQRNQEATRQRNNADAQQKNEQATQQRNNAEAQQRNQQATQQRNNAEAQQRNQQATQQRNNAEVQQRNQQATQQRNNAEAQQQRNNQVVRENQRDAGTRQVDNTGTPVRPTDATRQVRTHTAEPPPVRVNQVSANRVYREEKGALIRDDGTQIRHQNNEVFTRSPTNFNYDNPATFRLSAEFRTDYNNYNTWYDYRINRSYDYNSSYRPMSLEYRRDHYRYREPMYYSLIWTPNLFNRFMYYYPDYTDWDMEYGYEIETISSYDVMDYVGTVRRIYGRVEEVYYSREDNNYILYLGDRFPYQDLSVVIPENIAFRLTRSPMRYFNNQYIWMVGLIDMWEDKPEMVIRDEEQIRRY